MSYASSSSFARRRAVARRSARASDPIRHDCTSLRSPPVTAGQNIERPPSKSVVRRAVWRQPDPRSPPAAPIDTRSTTAATRRQPRAAHGRRLAPALLQTHARLRRASDHRRQDQNRDHPLPQAPHRARALPRLCSPTSRSPRPPPRRSGPIVSITRGARPIGQTTHS